MRKLGILHVVCIICLPVFTLAQGYKINLQGQKSQGMGGAGIALPQDGSAVFFNPGSVSFLKENSIDMSVSPVVYKGKYQDAASGDISKTNAPTTFVPSGYAVFGNPQSRLRYGIGVYVPYGSTMQWDPGWTGRFVLTKLQLFSLYVQPTISYKITDELGFGAGLVYAHGHVDIRKDIPVQDQQGNYGNAKLTGNSSNWGYNLGLYYKPCADFSLGLTYLSKVSAQVKNGNADFTVPASLSSGFPSGKFSASLPLPWVLGLGVAYKPIPKLSLALDLNYIGFGSYDTLGFNYATTTPTLQNTRSPRDYRNTIGLRLGGQYTVEKNLDVRAGVGYNRTPIKNGYVTPELPDANRLFYTVGLGYRFDKHWGTDLSFLYEPFKRTDTNLENKMSGTYHSHIFAPGIAISYKF